MCPAQIHHEKSLAGAMKKKTLMYNNGFIKDVRKINSSIDVTKVIMALLVGGMHIDAFGFNTWLDRCFCIIMVP